MSDKITKLLVGAVASLLAAPTAVAGPETLCPAGWSVEKEHGGSMYRFTAPGGKSLGEAELNLFPKDTPEDVRRLLDMKARHIEPHRTEPIGKPQSSQKFGVLMKVSLLRDEDNRNNRYITSALAGRHKLGGTMTCAIAIPIGNNNKPPAAFSKFMADCAAFLKSGAAFNEKQASKASKRDAVSKLVTQNGEPGEIAGYIFGLRYTYGVGGAVYPEYYPVVLYEGGLAVRELTAPPSRIDVKALRLEAPDDVGIWKTSDSSYLIEWPGSDDPMKVSMTTDRPQTFSDGQVLNGSWQSISGSGNTAMGGGTITAVSSRYTFYADGSFSTARSTGASAGGGSAWTKSGNAGTYRLAGGALTLEFRTGEILQTSLFYDNSKDGRKTLWIGGGAFSQR